MLLQMWRALRSLIILTGMIAAFMSALIWAGPLSSGALFLAWPTGAPATAHHLDQAYAPRHQGGVDVATGLYSRDDEDLVLTGTPPFVFTRTYRTQDRVSRAFGIGASNNAEWYLIGDTPNLRWVQLILEDGGRISFDRVSWGTSYRNARFISRGDRREFNGAEVGWMGRQWLLRYQDGRLAWFRDCPTAPPCSLIQLRDADGHVVDFRRNARGLVEVIEAETESIRLEYDARDRIVQARTNSGQHAAYSYDSAGRLDQATTSDGITRKYGYGPQDELITIEEPGRTIQNTYDSDGRVARQVVRLTSPEDATRSVFEFVYRIADGVVTETDMTEPDGTHTVYRFADRRTVLEIYDARGKTPVMVSIDRDANTGIPTRLTVRCTSSGRRLTRTAAVASDDQDEVKRELIARECSPGAPERR